MAVVENRRPRDRTEDVFGAPPLPYSQQSVSYMIGSC